VTGYARAPTLPLPDLTGMEFPPVWAVVFYENGSFMPRPRKLILSIMALPGAIIMWATCWNVGAEYERSSPFPLDTRPKNGLGDSFFLSLSEGFAGRLVLF